MAAVRSRPCVQYDLVGAARKMLAPEPRSPLEQIDQNTSGASLDDDDSETLGAPLLECAADLLDKVPQEDDDAELEDLDDKTALELAVSMMLEEDMPCKDRPVVETEGADMAVDMCM